MKKAFLTTKIESYKQESENSLTERIKDRQSHKSKSIMDDTNYKNIMNSNNVSKTYTPEGLAFKQIVKNNGRSTSSYNISNVNTNYNSYNINLNQNYNPSIFSLIYINFNFNLILKLRILKLVLMGLKIALAN